MNNRTESRTKITFALTTLCAILATVGSALVTYGSRNPDGSFGSFAHFTWLFAAVSWLVLGISIVRLRRSSAV